MIPKDVYKEISAKWDKKIYQRWEKNKDRLLLLDQYVENFRDKNVLEIGCNAGLAAYSICQVANSYQGFEPNTDYVAQFEITRTKIVNPSVKVFPAPFKSWENCEINALYASYVLYHMADDEIIDLWKNLLPKLDVVLILNRAKKRETRKNIFRMENMENVIYLLQSVGLKTMPRWGDKYRSFYAVLGVR